MKIHMKVSDFNVDNRLNMEVMINMEEFYAMLDEVKPRVLADYICKRMKEEEIQSSKLVNIFNIKGEGDVLL